MSLKSLTALVLSIPLVIGVVLTGGCVTDETVTPETPTRIIEDITPQEASTLIQDNQNNPDFIIIDVRTPEEFAEGYIENAINIDFYSETFRDELNNLDKDKTYLIYCRSGGRSGNALNIMAELNFREVYNISGGIIAWKAAGLPTTK
jgi:rhodanese-related sulfurtransferase